MLFFVAASLQHAFTLKKKEKKYSTQSSRKLLPDPELFHLKVKECDRKHHSLNIVDAICVSM